MIFPPTYADVGYNKGGGKNRRAFGRHEGRDRSTASAPRPTKSSRSSRARPYETLLVPQIDIAYGNEESASRSLKPATALATPSCAVSGKRTGCDLRGGGGNRPSRRSSQERNDASEIAKLAPTSLVFGAWDSRGDPRRSYPHRAVGRPCVERRRAASFGPVQPGYRLRGARGVQRSGEGEGGGEPEEPARPAGLRLRPGGRHPGRHRGSGARSSAT